MELHTLIFQLNPKLPPIDHSHLEKLIDSDAIKLFGAFDENKKLIGMLSLVLFPIPSGMRCWIEDVVIDQHHRRKRLGQTIMNYAIDYAREKGATTIDLTSRPSRIEANEMYRRMGFEKRDTNVYRMNLLD
jgi:ribosomal protein S18 acetylase RimI-like enzyme